MSFIPMNFRKTYRTIREAYIGNPFSLQPATMTETRQSLWQLADQVPNSDCFRFGNLTNDLKIHFHAARCNQL
jgi:hypothetical protein